jgi:hypothetical protein
VKEIADPLIRDYVSLLLLLARDDGRYSTWKKLRTKFAGLFDVHAFIHSSNRTEIALLDAMLLGRHVDPDYVTQQTGLSELQQDVYQKLFIDLEDRRHMTVFIASQLLEPLKFRESLEQAGKIGVLDFLPDDPTPRRGSLSLSRRVALRVLGFYAGPRIVEYLYTGLRADSKVLGEESVVRYVSQAIISAVRRTGLFQSFLPERQEAELALNFAKAAVQLAQDDSAGSQSDITRHVQAFYEAVRPRFGHVGDILEDNGVYSGGAIELTDQDVFAANEGTPSESMKILLEHDRAGTREK